MTNYPAVIFTDAEALACDYLRVALAGEGQAVPVGTRVPNPRPAAFVTVARLGGVRTSLVTDTARLDVQAWASSDEAAADLGALARALIQAMPGRASVPVYRVVEVGGLQWLPDEASGQARYVFAVEISIRGEAL